MALGFVAPHFPTDCSIKMTLVPPLPYYTDRCDTCTLFFLQPFPETQSWEHAPCTPPPPLMQAAPLGDFTCIWRYLEPVLSSMVQRSFRETASCFLSESDGWNIRMGLCYFGFLVGLFSSWRYHVSVFEFMHRCIVLSDLKCVLNVDFSESWISEPLPVWKDLLKEPTKDRTSDKAPRMWRDLSVGISKMSFTPRQLQVMSLDKLVHSMVKVSMMTDDLSGARETVLMVRNWMDWSVIFIDWGILHLVKVGQ